MKKGFTLIELLVVVLIIGILSSIALPQYTNAVEKARTSEALSMIGSLKTGIDAYVLANGYESVRFVGEVGGIPHVTLDVDAEASLDCSAGEGVCEGKYFTYNAFCHDGGYCYISVFRQTLEEYRNDDLPKYDLSARKDANGWTYECYGYSEIGDFICKSLQTQGWTVEALYGE